MSGWTELLKRLTREGGERYLAAKVARRVSPEARYLIGTKFGSWQGLAEEILRKSRWEGGNKVFKAEVSHLKHALSEWSKFDDYIGKLLQHKKAGSFIEPRRIQEGATMAMEAEQNLVQALKRVGLERKRSAQLLSRLKNLAKPGTEGGDILRGAMRQEGGTMSLRSRPGTHPGFRDQKVMTDEGIERIPFVEGRPHQGPTAYFAQEGGPEGNAFGTINMAPTRDEVADLLIAGHEGPGHGLQQIARNLPLQDFRGAGGPRAFGEMMRDLERIAEDLVPFRQAGSAVKGASSMHRAQQAVGKTLDPQEMRGFLGNMQQAERTSQLPEAAKQELRRTLLPSRSHGPEEPFSDLMAILLDPQARRALPFQAKVSLSRWWPHLFPELQQARAAAGIVP